MGCLPFSFFKFRKLLLKRTNVASPLGKKSLVKESAKPISVNGPLTTRTAVHGSGVLQKLPRDTTMPHRTEAKVRGTYIVPRWSSVGDKLVGAMTARISKVAKAALMAAEVMFILFLMISVAGGRLYSLLPGA